MGRFICLHTSGNNSEEIWINADAIVAVADERHMHSWTRIYTYADTEGYCVEETVGSVIGLIKQQTNPLDNYVCQIPDTVKDWSLGKETKRCYE